MAIIDPSTAYANSLRGMSYDDLLRQVQAGINDPTGYLRQSGKDYSPTYGATANINNDRMQQITSMGDLANPNLTTKDANYVGADGTKDWGYVLGRGADGNVSVTPQYHKNDPYTGLMLALGAMGGMTFLPEALGTLGAEAGATSGASLAGTGAAGAGEAASTFLADQFPSEMAKLVAQNAAAPGSLFSTSLPTLATTAGGGMSFLSDLLPSGVSDFLGSKAGGALAGGLLSALGSKDTPSSTTQTSATQLDPRMQSILYGANGNNGFVSQIMNNMNTPQSPGTAAFGGQMGNYLQNWGEDNFARSQQAAQGLQGSNISAPTASAAQVQAPNQNNIDLAPAYQDMVYGQAGNNSYLTGAIQKGINQSNNAFGNYLTDATKSTNDLLGNIRGGAVLNNTMGSSRQGIAEGRAIGDFTQNIGRAASQFGQNNTDAAVSAQAGAYDADRNRSLAAMSGLGAQQYGVASQNAQMQQQANLANLQSQLGTNQLNSQNQTAGVGLSSGLLGQAYNYGTNQDAYDSNKLSQTSGLLAPYTGLGQSQSTTTPLYSNTTGNVLGGAMAGMGLWNAFNK